MNNTLIRAISPQDTWPIRHQVMWPDRPLEYIKLAEDEQGLHFGLFVREKLVSVVSLFVKGDSAQFRKFATLESEQGKGYGSQLLRQVLQEAQNQGALWIWCNARVPKTRFYAKFGLQATKTTFTKGEIDYIVLQKTLLCVV